MFKKIGKAVNKFNEFVAVNVTLGMSTMWCAWAFLVFALLPQGFPQLDHFVNYVSTNLIQLVALPLITVGAAILSRSSEKRAKEDHLALRKMFSEIKVMHSEMKDQITEIKDLHEDIHNILKNK